MDHRLTPEQENAIIEDALTNYPLATMPRDITASVMQQIQKAPMSQPFQMTWADFAISLVIAMCVGAIWFTIQNLPPLILLRLHIQSVLLYQAFIVNMHWFVPSLLFGLAAFLSALTLPYLQKQLKT